MKLEKGMKIISNTLQEYIYKGFIVGNNYALEENTDCLDYLEKEYIDIYKTCEFNNINTEKWICNECGKEVKIQETIKQKFIYSIDENGYKTNKKIVITENDWAYECDCGITGKGVELSEIATFKE